MNFIMYLYCAETFLNNSDELIDIISNHPEVKFIPWFLMSLLIGKVFINKKMSEK